jgi:hypothetical protein
VGEDGNKSDDKEGEESFTDARKRLCSVQLLKTKFAAREASIKKALSSTSAGVASPDITEVSPVTVTAAAAGDENAPNSVTAPAARSPAASGGRSSSMSSSGGVRGGGGGGGGSGGAEGVVNSGGDEEEAALALIVGATDDVDAEEDAFPDEPSETVASPLRPDGGDGTVVDSGNNNVESGLERRRPSMGSSASRRATMKKASAVRTLAAHPGLILS